MLKLSIAFVLGTFAGIFYMTLDSRQKQLSDMLQSQLLQCKRNLYATHASIDNVREEFDNVLKASRTK